MPATDMPSASVAAARPRLSVRALSKRYGSLQALADVDFELRPGEVMALLGENGAGKSTLVKVLSGLVHPDAGEIEIDGKPAELYPSARSQAAGVAVVHQEYSSVPTLSVAENLVLGQTAQPAIWLPGRLRARARKLLAAVGLDHIDPPRLGRQPECRRAAAARNRPASGAGCADPDLRRADRGVADREIERVLSVIKRLAGEGRSVIYVTHRLPEVFRIADRVTVFRNGRSLPPRPTSELNVDAVIAMMLGRDLETMYPPRGPAPDGNALLAVRGLAVEGLAAPVAFDVRPGEIVGLTGQLGSGANTVVQALAGMLATSAGTVLLDGVPLSLKSRAATLAAGVAYCSADRKHDGIFAERSIRENLSSPWVRSVSASGFISARRENERAQEIASRFAIDVKRLSSFVGTLSGGNQQKVAVGKWLGARPRIMLIEEPTRGVDVGARAEIYQRLRDLCGTASASSGELRHGRDPRPLRYRGHLLPRPDDLDRGRTRSGRRTSSSARSCTRRRRELADQDDDRRGPDEA